MKKSRPRVVIITNSAENVIMAVGLPNDKEIRTLSIPIQKIDQEKVIDTNAAGDTFVGGLLA